MMQALARTITAIHTSNLVQWTQDPTEEGEKGKNDRFNKQTHLTTKLKMFT